MKLYTAAPVNRDTELSVIGVKTTGMPSLTTFPKNFSNDGFKIWKGLFDSDNTWYADLRRKLTDSSEVWFAVVQHYLKLCSKNGIYPFRLANQQTQNEVVSSFVMSSRRKLVAFVDKHEMFTKVRIQSVERKFTFRDTSFSIESTALLKPIEDPTFGDWLKSFPGPHFKRADHPGRLEKVVQSNVDLFFDLANPRQPKMTIKIFCHTPLSVPDYSKLPSKAKLTQLAEKSIWLPAVRNARFKNSGTRLF
jgi:hypothetical protein